MARSAQKGHHHLRRHRRDPHAVHVAVPAGDAGRDRRSAAIGAAEAGAAILHLHARDPETGQPDQTPEAFARFLPRIKQATNAVVNITTGGSPYMTRRGARAAGGDLQAGGRLAQHGLDEFRPVPDAERTRSSSTTGSGRTWKTRATSSSATPSRTSSTFCATCGDNGTRFEFECYDIAHLYNLAHFLDRGLVKPPLFVQTVFGILGGIGPHPEDVLHMKRTADRLFGDHVSLVGARRRAQPDADRRPVRAAMGGNVRVGLEDSLWAGRGQLAKSNAEQVALVRQIIEGLGARGRHAGRGARDPRAQGRRQGRVLVPAWRRPSRRASASPCLARAEPSAAESVRGGTEPLLDKSHDWERAAPLAPGLDPGPVGAADTSVGSEVGMDVGKPAGTAAVGRVNMAAEALRPCTSLCHPPGEARRRSRKRTYSRPSGATVGIYTTDHTGED